jgi:nucleoside-diphosphate-sugar epimerase
VEHVVGHGDLVGGPTPSTLPAARQEHKRAEGIVTRQALIVGCGYLGRALARQWRQEGWVVVGTTRSPAGTVALREQGIEPVVCDVLDVPGLASLPRADVVVHCVGLDRTSGQSMRAVYVEGLANVVAALTRDGPGPGRFVYVSSAGVYGQGDGVVVDEGSATGPADDSGRVVLEAEQLLRERMPSALVLRCAGLYGPGRLIRAQALRAGEPITGDGDKWLNLIHVEDAAAAVQLAAERGRAGAVYNVCDGQPVRRRDFYAALADLLGAPPPRFVPYPPGAAPPRSERADRRVSNRRLREELGFVPRYPSYVEGLAASLG